MFHIWLYPVEELIWSPPLIHRRRFSRYTNVSITSAQDCGGSPEPCDIAWVPLVAALFGEGEYGTNKMIHALVAKFLHLFGYQLLRIVEYHCSDVFVGAVLH